MASLLFWKTAHLLCIFSHLSMMAASAVAFVYTSRRAANFIHIGARDLPFAAWGTFAAGLFGMGTNLGLFRTLKKIEEQAGDGLVLKHFENQSFAVVIGCVLNIVVVGADAAMSALLARLAGDAGDSASYLYASCALSAIASLMALTTIVADVVKFLRHDRYRKNIFNEWMEDHREEQGLPSINV